MSDMDALAIQSAMRRSAAPLEPEVARGTEPRRQIPWLRSFFFKLVRNFRSRWQLVSVHLCELPEEHLRSDLLSSLRTAACPSSLAAEVEATPMCSPLLGFAEPCALGAYKQQT